MSIEAAGMNRKDWESRQNHRWRCDKLHLLYFKIGIKNKLNGENSITFQKKIYTIFYRLVSLTVRDFALGLQETRTIRYDPICKTCSSPVTLAQKMINSTTTLGAISAVTAQNQEYHQQKLAFLLGQIWFVYHHRTNSQFLPLWTESPYSSRCFLMEFWGSAGSQQNWGNFPQNSGEIKCNLQTDRTLKPPNAAIENANQDMGEANAHQGQTSDQNLPLWPTIIACGKVVWNPCRLFLVLGWRTFWDPLACDCNITSDTSYFSKAPHVLSGRNLCHKKHVCWGCSLLQGPLCQSRL